MKFNTILLALIAVAYCAGQAKKEYRGPSEADVVVLSEDTIESLVYESDEPWFLDLYAEWCSHCHDMRPQWAKLATKLKGVVKVAKMEAGGKLSLLEGYDFKGYPILVFIPAGKKMKRFYYTYDGSRTVSDMSSWVMEKMQQSKALYLPRITSQEVWNDYCVNVGKPLCVIFILPHIRDSSINERAVTLEIVKEVIINYKDKPLSFLWTQATDHPELELQFGFGAGYPVVLLLNQYRKAYTVMKKSLTSENLVGFLDKVLTPTKDRTKLGQYSKELFFNSVTPDQDEPIPTGGSVDEEL